MATKEKQEVSITAKFQVTLAENGIFDKVTVKPEEEEPTENDIGSDDSEPSWELEEGLNDESSWIGQRGSNKSPTRGVIGPQANNHKSTQAGPSKSTQAGPKCTQADPKTVKK